MSYNGSIEVAVSDVDFYQRKIIRLEDDIALVHEELVRARTRLRNAEDFQIKYHILLSQYQQEVAELKVKIKEEPEEGENGEDKENEERQQVSEGQWRKKEYELQQRIRGQTEKELNLFRQERDEHQRTIHELTAQRQESGMLVLKIKSAQKENQGLKQQLQDNRVHFERRKEEQLNELKSRLSQNYKERMGKERKVFEGKINELQKRLVDLEVSKDHEIFKLPTSNNNQLAAIRQLYEEACKTHTRERQDLQDRLQQKSKDIMKLMEGKAKSEEKYRSDFQEKEGVISLLERNILEKEKEHQEEITSALYRIKELKEREMSDKDDHIRQLQADIASQKEWWSTKLLNHDKEIENLTHKYQEEIKRLHEHEDVLKEKIADLSKRVKDVEGEREQGETQQLIASFKDMEQKGMHMANYQDGVTFLEQQLSRCQKKLQEKMRALQDANIQLANSRAEASQEAIINLQRTIAMKQQNSGKVKELEKRIAELNYQLRQSEKAFKRVQREKIVQQNQNGVELSKLKFQIKEIRKDYKRVIESKKEMDANYRTERQKNMGSNTDLSGTTKIKWLQLQKQKNDLEFIFRQKEEQLKLKLGGQIQHKDSQLAQLKYHQHMSDKDNELLKQENKKLREELECNKQNCKASNYQHKLATVSLQLALTQNIYKQLLQAKSRNNEPEVEQPLRTQMEQVEGPLKTESQEPLLMSVDPTSFKRQE